MAVKKNGLGKGLDSLIPANKSVKSSSSSASSTEKKEDDLKTGETLLNINMVEPNRKQPRKNFEEDALDELAESIKQHGILQPLLVRKNKDYYEIIGELQNGQN